MRARWRGPVAYYFFDTGGKERKEIALGKNYTDAVRKWAELSGGDNAGALITFRAVADRYVREVLPSKAPATQEINLRELAHLMSVFDVPPMPIDDIEPVHVRQYLDLRGKVAPVAANREKALLSHIFNFARNAGLTVQANPCAGIKGKSEAGRDVYTSDAVMQAVWQAASGPLRDALDLAYLTGQRVADVLKLSRADARDGAIAVVQNKTGAKVRVEIVGELARVMDRINARKVSGLTLICDDKGRALTKFGLRGAFDRARIAAALACPALADEIKAFQFRDLRAKAGTDTEELRGMAAAKDQLGHSSEVMTAHYVRHRRGKLVKPTK